MKIHQLITIKAEARPGLLHLITGVIEKRLVQILSLNAAPTDIHEIVLVTVEVSAEEKVTAQLALKLQNIVEVFAVEVATFEEESCLSAAYFRLTKQFLETSQANVLSRHNATIVKVESETILLSKFGTRTMIQRLYNDLDGPNLLGFSQTALICTAQLIGENQSSVILKAA